MSAEESRVNEFRSSKRRQRIGHDKKEWENLSGTNHTEDQRYRKPRKLPQEVRQNPAKTYKKLIKNRPSNTIKSGGRNPRKAYKKEWKVGVIGWGPNFIAHQKRKCRPYKEARKIAHSLGLNNQSEWKQYRTLGKRPRRYPSHPIRT
jgi:hypothetical protein